jgi:hypothetical protein
MDLFEKFPYLPKHKMPVLTQTSSTVQCWNPTDAAVYWE